MRRVGAFAFLVGLVSTAVSFNYYQAFSNQVFLPYSIITFYPMPGILYLLVCSILASSMNASLIIFLTLFYFGLASVASGLALLAKNGWVAGVLAFLILFTGVPVPQIHRAITSSVPYSFLIFDTVGMSGLYVVMSPWVYYTIRVFWGTTFFLYYMCFLDLFYRHLLLSTLYYFNTFLAVGDTLVLLIIGTVVVKKLRSARSLLIGLLKSSERVRFDEAAKRFGLSVKEVESITLELLAKDEIQGTITEKNVFVSAGGIAETVKRQISPKEEGIAPRVEKGEPVKITGSETKKCPFCGASVKADAKSCPNCGGVLV